MEKLSIKNEMVQFDRKNRGFYDDLTDEERKKFSNYLMIRWGSAVRGSRDLQEFYVIATNERLNRHFFAVNRHPRLQWLMATTVSPDLGTHDHVWLAPKKKETGSNEVKKILLDLYPAMKISDIETLAALVDKKELKDYLREHGNPD
jgi:hypothetical protein